MNGKHVTLAAVVGALAGGAVGGAAFWALTGPFALGDHAFGTWTSNTQVGQARQNPYSRASVALYGIWGLPQTETIYFLSGKDSDGAPLRSDCTYKVLGGALPTRWWSLTLYRNGYYIPNSADRYSWSKTDTPASADGRWALTLAPSGEGPGRLTFGSGSGKLQLLLRLYQPNRGIAADRSKVPLPQIRRKTCARREV